MKRNPLPLLLLLAATLSTASCLAIAGVGVGYIISREELANSSFEAQVKDDVENVWPAALEAFEILRDPRSEATITEDLRRIVGQVDYADVTIDIEAHDIERTIIRVSAESYGTADRDTAQDVLDRILDRLSMQSR